MPAVLPPMGCSEFTELELETVAMASPQQPMQLKQQLPPPLPKSKSVAVRKPKIEAPSPSRADSKLGVRGNAKFKKPVGDHQPGSSGGGGGWLAMMENDAAGFLMGHHAAQLNGSSAAAAISSGAATNTTTAIVAATTKVESSKKSNGAKAESSNRKYYPAPFCSCTGTNQQCYRWGNGGWQSACCTTKISMYPLPMNPKKKGSRLAGRKMSAGAFMKLLDRLTAEGVDVNSSVDLRPHWAKHGTNRYVTIK